MSPSPAPPGLPEDVARRMALLSRALVSVLDLGEAMSTWRAQRNLRLGSDHDGEPLQKAVIRALRSAAVVAYARPFLGSNRTGGSRDRLTLADVGYVAGVEYSQWWFDLHHVILDLRNRFIAHGDSDHKGRDSVIRAKLEPGGALEIHAEVNNYHRMLDELEYGRVARLMDIVEHNAQRLAYRLAEDRIRQGHLESDLRPDMRAHSLVLQMRRGAKLPPSGPLDP